MSKNLFRNDLSTADCAKLIEAWELHRGADGAENVFDLYDKKDFRLMIRSRGIITALNLRKSNRFWFDGMNYKEPVPFPQNADEARKLAENMIEERYLIERPDIYADFV